MKSLVIIFSITAILLMSGCGGGGSSTAPSDDNMNPGDDETPSSTPNNSNGSSSASFGSRYFPLEVGNTWTYEIIATDEPTEQEIINTQTITSASSQSATIREINEGANFPLDWNVDVNYEIAGTDISVKNSIPSCGNKLTYIQPLPIHLPDSSLGTDVSFSTTMQSSGTSCSSAPDATTAIYYESHVIGQESITTLLGTFNAMRIEGSLTHGDTMTTHFVKWYVENIGMVRQTATTTYSSIQSSATTETILVAYTVDGVSGVGNHGGTAGPPSQDAPINIPSAHAPVARSNPILYVSNTGRYDTDPGISAISTVSDTLVGTTTYSFTPGILATNPDGSRLYVVNTESKGLSVVETETMDVVATIPLGNIPQAVVVNNTGTRVYVANGESNIIGLSNTISVIDTATNTIIENIALPYLPGGFAIHPTDTHLYVTGGGIADDISIIDTTTNMIIASIPNDIFSVPSMRFISNAVVNPEGTKLYVACLDGIYVIDTATNIPSENIIPDVPSGDMAFTPDGTRMFIGTGNTLSVVDTSTNIVIATVVNVGYDVVFNETGSQAYVVDDVNSSISVIDNGESAISVVKTIDVPYWPVGVAR